jgi:hypothetical protein
MAVSKVDGREIEYKTKQHWRMSDPTTQYNEYKRLGGYFSLFFLLKKKLASPRLQSYGRKVRKPSCS